MKTFFRQKKMEIEIMDISLQRILDELHTMAQPYDLDGLVEIGILKKTGGWYSGIPLSELPPNMRFNTYAVSSDGSFKIRKNGWRSAQRAYERVKSRG